MTALKMHDTETTIINGEAFLTRYWYMDCAKHLTGYERHVIFYGQFADKVAPFVKSAFSEAEWQMIVDAKDHRHFNDIFEIRRWDRIDVRQIVGGLYSDCCYVNRPKGRFYWSPSDNTCIVKAAVRYLLEQEGKLKDDTKTTFDIMP